MHKAYLVTEPPQSCKCATDTWTHTHLWNLLIDRRTSRVVESFIVPSSSASFWVLSEHLFAVSPSIYLLLSNARLLDRVPKTICPLNIPDTLSEQVVGQNVCLHDCIVVSAFAQLESLLSAEMVNRDISFSHSFYLSLGVFVEASR